MSNSKKLRSNENSLLIVQCMAIKTNRLLPTHLKETSISNMTKIFVYHILIYDLLDHK